MRAPAARHERRQRLWQPRLVRSLPFTVLDSLMAVEPQLRAETCPYLPSHYNICSFFMQRQ